ncbi:zinc finger protein CONSTANS-LIKE 9-like isoform X1 [Olea europaea var. sylvestris]|nr:zinc finger protein CONSTANS-LIKE 9-like isoform X1 [Olea europaea var. sylvestris]
MQDIGVCDELQCFDDLHIPDVDLTFRNFEELFGCEQEQTRVLVDDENMSCSFAGKHSSLSKPESFRARTMESADANKVFDSSDEVLHFRTINEYPRPIQPSYSTSSFSVSRITAENTSSEYKDDGLFPEVDEQILLGNSSNPENAKLDGKENIIMRYSKEKKARWREKRVRHSSQKAKSDGKKRGKGKFLLAEAYESESVSVTRSF